MESLKKLLDDFEGKATALLGGAAAFAGRLDPKSGKVGGGTFVYNNTGRAGVTDSQAAKMFKDGKVPEPTVNHGKLSPRIEPTLGLTEKGMEAFAPGREMKGMTSAQQVRAGRRALRHAPLELLRAILPPKAFYKETSKFGDMVRADKLLGSQYGSILKDQTLHAQPRDPRSTLSGEELMGEMSVTKNPFGGIKDTIKTALHEGTHGQITLQDKIKELRLGVS